MNSRRVKLINILSHCEVSDPSYFTHNVHHPHIVSLLIKSINCYVDSLKWTLLSIEWFLALKNFNKLKFHAKCKVFLRSFFIKMKNSCSVFKMCSEVLKSDFLSFINIYNFLLQLFATSTTKKFFFIFSWLSPSTSSSTQVSFCNPFSSLRELCLNVRRYLNFSVVRVMRMKRICLIFSWK